MAALSDAEDELSLVIQPSGASKALAEDVEGEQEAADISDE